jgi:hypothetical protein
MLHNLECHYRLYWEFNIILVYIALKCTALLRLSQFLIRQNYIKAHF